MGSQVGVSFLVSSVLGNEMKIFAADNQGSVHFHRDNGSGEDTATNRDHTGEGAFLVWRRIVY